MKKLFVIGDSISCYYGVYLEKMLTDIMHYDRKGKTNILKDLDDCTDGVNGGDSSMVLSYMEEVIHQDWFKPDILLFNCGIHDTKKNQQTGELQIPLPSYTNNLTQIIRLIKEQSIQPIWVRTTPLNPISVIPATAITWHTEDDITAYNNAADTIMQQNSVPTIDLFSFTKTLGNDIYLNQTDHVHFTESAASQQAAFIAGWLSMLQD